MAFRRLTEIDLRVLDTLTHRVRVADEGQLEAVCKANVKSRLVRLQERGFLQRGTVAVRRPEFASPVSIWQPGDATPAAGPLAWKLQKRWKRISPQVITVWWGTSEAARLMGGVGGRLRQPLQVAHDLGVTDIYLRYLAAGEQDGEWMGEDDYRSEHRPSRKVKVPDAVLLNAADDIERVFEFGGAYPARRVREFHRYWFRRQIPYELW
jgi:hypothetical protein